MDYIIAVSLVVMFAVALGFVLGKITITAHCGECDSKLTGSFHPDTGVVSINPCPVCIATATENGKGKGYKAGFDDGFNEGYVQRHLQRND